MFKMEMMQELGAMCAALFGALLRYSGDEVLNVPHKHGFLAEHPAHI
jgi:hypothetical protein